jgi:hypothetical protein
MSVTRAMKPGGTLIEQYHTVVMLLQLVTALSHLGRPTLWDQQWTTYYGSSLAKQSVPVSVMDAFVAILSRNREVIAASLRDPNPGCRDRSTSLTVLATGLDDPQEPLRFLDALGKNYLPVI